MGREGYRIRGREWLERLMYLSRRAIPAVVLSEHECKIECDLWWVVAVGDVERLRVQVIDVDVSREEARYGAADLEFL